MICIFKISTTSFPPKLLANDDYHDQFETKNSLWDSIPYNKCRPPFNKFMVWLKNATLWSHKQLVNSQANKRCSVDHPTICEVQKY